MPMSSEELRAELRRGVDTLQMLRDEIRVHVHLATMDVRTKWNELEPRVHEIEALAQNKGEEAREALKDAVTRLRELRDTVIKH